MEHQNEAVFCVPSNCDRSFSLLEQQLMRKFVRPVGTHFNTYPRERNTSPRCHCVVADDRYEQQHRDDG
jgi:hypothetical protein